MATEFEKSFNNYQKHTVGNLNSWKIRTLNHGAKVTEDVDNFHIVELGFDNEGQRTASYLTDVTKKGYLIATPERRYMDEPMDSFFNSKDDMARIVYLDEGIRFETSAFDNENVANGNFAHYDPKTKSFIIHDGSHEDYSKATDKFLVVGSEDDVDYRFDVPVVRLEKLPFEPVATTPPTP